MKDRLAQAWLKPDRIDGMIQLEPLLLIFGLTVGAWIVYKLFLSAVSDRRHTNLQNLFKNLTSHIGIMTALFAVYSGLSILHERIEFDFPIARFNSYIGLLVIAWAALCFVKVWRILTFEYLFLGHMKVGVPLLIVNLVSLVITVILTLWTAAEAFGLQVAPVLAGSAIASLVLGLALQDTLGNLFSGVALQFDKPYEIEDWIEVQNGPLKWVGQVEEITWRATVLIGLSDELITIPNRIIAGAQIANYSLRKKPICRSHVFRIDFGVDPAHVRSTLLRCLEGHPVILKSPSPVVFASETTESFVIYKLVYFISDFGKQWSIGDQVIERALQSLTNAKIPLAQNRVLVSGNTNAQLSKV